MVYIYFFQLFLLDRAAIEENLLLGRNRNLQAFLFLGFGFADCRRQLNLYPGGVDKCG